MVKAGFPLAPFILGVILGDQIETNLVRSIMTDADPWLFVTRPISGALLGLSVASVVVRPLAAPPRRAPPAGAGSRPGSRLLGPARRAGNRPERYRKAASSPERDFMKAGA